MLIFIKKPKVIEAIKYTGINFNELQKFVNTKRYKLKMTECQTPVVEALRGDQYISIGDFVVREVNGRFSVYKSDTFADLCDLYLPNICIGY